MNRTRSLHRASNSPAKAGTIALSTALALVVLALPQPSPAQAAAGAGPFDEDYYEAINGTHLHFRVRGQVKANPYLLLLHGGPGSSAIQFYPWGELLERQLNVVYLDQRGCGLSERAQFKTPGHPSPAEASGFTFENMVWDIEGVRRRLGVKQWFVLGHSFGGMVGVEYVTAHSERVLGYIHMNGLTSMRLVNLDWLEYAERAVKETERTADAKDRARIEEVLRNVERVRSMTAEERNQAIGDLVIAKIQPERIRDRFPAANAYDARIDAEALARYKISPQALSAPEPRAAMNRVEAMAEREVIPLFGDVRTPTLSVSAAGDPIIPTKRAAFMHRRIPRSRLVLIRNAAHEVFKDQPEHTARAVLGFVESALAERARTKLEHRAGGRTCMSGSPVA
jgi:proline iminopeptidase